MMMIILYPKKIVNCIIFFRMEKIDNKGNVKTLYLTKKRLLFKSRLLPCWCSLYAAGCFILGYFQNDGDVSAIVSMKLMAIKGTTVAKNDVAMTGS